jgi:glycosyltransferase involved in cell wall biosynthesis
VAPDRLLVLSPIAPARRGNGLAMRVANLVDVAKIDREVTVAVVPVSGIAPVQDRIVETVEIPLLDGTSAAGIGALLADPEWRARLTSAAPMPWRARAASPDLAGTVVAAVSDGRGAAVHVVRSYLAPLGLAVAERLGAWHRTLDLDDDDETVSRALGDEDEAAAYHRLVAAFAPAFDAVVAASAETAAAIAARHGFDVGVIANAVDVPADPERHPSRPPDLLLVGNLTYAPNVAAAHALATEVLPEVRRRTGQDVTATIVGAHEPSSEVAALAWRDGVRVLGFVDDLAPMYAACTCAVVPLEVGSGSRTKLLEAFAHDVPVVCTPAAAAGLDVVHGEHLLLGASAGDLAEHASAVIHDPSTGALLTVAARTFVASHHSLDAVAPAIEAVLGRH